MKYSEERQWFLHVTPKVMLQEWSQKTSCIQTLPCPPTNYSNKNNLRTW